jgi:hypothetical protein
VRGAGRSKSFSPDKGGHDPHSLGFSVSSVMERPLFRVAHLVLLFAIRDWPGDQTRFKRRRAPFPAPDGRSVLLKTGTQYVVRVAAAARRTSRYSIMLVRYAVLERPLFCALRTARRRCIADETDRNLGRLNWRGSGPTGVASEGAESARSAHSSEPQQIIRERRP